MEATKSRQRPRPRLPAQAPGRLRLVQDFVNSIDHPEGRDDLRTPEALTLWLAQRDLMPISLLDEAEWRNALEVREGLRAVLRVHSGESIDEETLKSLNDAIGDAHLRVRFASDGTCWIEGVEPGWMGALAQVVAAIFESTNTGDWERLKTCDNEQCRRAFYDSSEDVGARWCDERRCGGGTGRTTACRDSRVRRAPRAR